MKRMFALLKGRSVHAGMILAIALGATQLFATAGAKPDRAPQACWTCLNCPSTAGGYSAVGELCLFCCVEP